ncbi:MAG: hypothetical protein MJZ56_06365 [Bacteroidales bacterium]|nr:hypothetical protein [Bacteroidales bacterium]
MKKTIRLFTTLMVCMAMALCVSCKKDDDKSDTGGGGNTGGGGGGSQTVEARLSKISANEVGYLEGSTDGGQTWNVIDVDSAQVNEIYTWNNNLLSKGESIAIKDGTVLSRSAVDFLYDNNKLSNAIRTYSHDGRIDTLTYDVEYDGDNMSKVTVHDYEDGGYESVYHLEYSNGKLSSVTYRTYSSYLFWNGDNFSEGRNITDGCETTISLSYDDKKNPYYGIDALLAIGIEGVYSLAGGSLTQPLSKNNYTKYEVEIVSGGDQLETVTDTRDYTYNGENYPTQVIVNETVLHASSPLYPQYELSRGRVVATVTYEYLD